ncbi:DNA segregation ATPase FtsK/SpoIIIE, S-DNA-T family [Xylanibacter ruminicola]|uniref:DNA segregation ATPase FtsK/SpoIIIE, S-DNA-T family n=1 Tax=Xylanibacter ruminicola TaxID=839 RepID=A0A1H4APP0_XYLRU|nr:DNA translocase FtsK [Xylanibacter ruminicola]SEA37684.1 DNA segregation ATPase FtsK/SpoIIIE, S-DNA-T family [Xylanibacter ruminicola]
MNIFSKLFGHKNQKETNQSELLDNSEEELIFDDPQPQKVRFIDSYVKDKQTQVKGHKDTYVEESPKTNEPKDIPEAIKFIVSTLGRASLNNRGFINILNDFHLLKDNPAAKNVLLSMLDEGYIKRMTSVNSWEVESLSICQQYVNEFGTKQNLVSFIINSFGYGLGYIKEKPTFLNESKKTKSKEVSEQVSTENVIIETNEDYDPHRDLPDYSFPNWDLLEFPNRPYMDKAEIDSIRDRIIEILKNSFRFEISSIKLVRGANVDFWEIEPAPGMSFGLLKDAEEEFTMFLSPKGVRILAPIPGSNKLGIEVPRNNPDCLYFQSIVNCKEFERSSMELPCVIGKETNSKVFMFDLCTLPHLLIGGATGQGKSICIHTILLSLLFKKHPSDLKLVLIDFKKIELSAYAAIANHFLAAHVDYDKNPIISSSEQALKTFAALKVELDSRYELIASSGTRNIQDYNKKFCSRRLNPADGHKFLPYIVIVIDEYSELMNDASRILEPIILEIAKKGRTVGIHLIISTNRPTADVISTSIKSELTGRISFRVNTTTDSRLILNYGGAEKLVGNGDMYFTARNSGLLRIQCAQPSFEDIDKVCNFIQKQKGYFSVYELDDYIPEPLPPIDLSHLDPLFDDAARLIVMYQSGSTSLIQRKFAIGYNRAGLIMDQLEKAGVVGAAMGSKPREVLINDENSLNNLLNCLR